MESAEVIEIESSIQKVQGIDQDTEIQLIPVRVIQQSPSNIGSISPRGKYYKQTYRRAWEHMPDFKGWLRGVEGEPTRAFCTYCHKTLHAHRLSLLKHTCTIRHQKAAQVHSARKNKISLEMRDDTTEEESRDVSNDGDLEMENEEYEDEDEEEELTQNASEGFDNSSEILETVTVKESVQKTVSDRPPISTHVTDMTRGKPICGLQVSLYKLIEGRWTFINEGVTNNTGNFSQFINRSDFTTGRYKLHFDVDRYFDAKKQNTLYPFIEIVFDAGLFNDSYHIPLLLSPYGYTTHRGS